MLRHLCCLLLRRAANIRTKTKLEKVTVKRILLICVAQLLKASLRSSTTATRCIISKIETTNQEKIVATLPIVWPKRTHFTSVVVFSGPDSYLKEQT